MTDCEPVVDALLSAFALSSAQWRVRRDEVASLTYVDGSTEPLVEQGFLLYQRVDLRRSLTRLCVRRAFDAKPYVCSRMAAAG